MIRKRHLIVIDPTAFSSGSKVATENILRLLDTEQTRITILTADAHSWRLLRCKRIRLYQPRWLASKDQGITYFLRHICIALNVLFLRFRFGRFDIALGASGSGVDLALYLLKPVLGIKIIQLIHGPVAQSNTIARSLMQADEVHYLKSCRDSLVAMLSRLTDTPQNIMSSHFHIMQNGLSLHAWPSPCQTLYPAIFWAASRLKWKELETLLAALNKIAPECRPATHICYIKPQHTQLDLNPAPIVLERVHWYENPINIDQIRASTNIFISTSSNEPFGLSILEAMAAGLCILIPSDGAYWDRTLNDNIDCVKYQAGDADDLAQRLLMLSKNMKRVTDLGGRAAKIALNYRAQEQYANLKKSLTEIVSSPDVKNVCKGQNYD
ncbi:MAG: glycosyltransferase involved in cell wall biosynthesis [Moritella sp.]|jgi:glycosyltransferase involved in cell wall biosynthesis